MDPEKPAMQRKRGVGVFQPVSWNRGRRFTTTELSAFPEEGPLSSQNPVVRMQVEAYLDDNEEFAESYVMRKVKRSTIEKWLTQFASSNEKQNHDTFGLKKEPLVKSRSLSMQMTPTWPQQDSCRPSGSRGSSRRSSRRMSASTFESGGLQSPILTTSEDGSVSFLTAPSKTRSPWNMSDLRRVIKMGRQENLMEVQHCLVNELDPTTLCFKIAKNVCLLSRSLCCSVFTLEKTPCQPCYQLYCSALNVLPTSDNFESHIRDMTVTITETDHLLRKVCEGSPVAADMRKDEAELRVLSGLLDDAAEHVKFLPLADLSGEVLAIAAICHSTEVPENTAITNIVKLAGICLKNSQEHNSVQLEVTRSQVFLDLARVIFSQQTTIEFTVLKILANFLSLIECEQSQILLSSSDSPTTFSKVYDLQEDDLSKDDWEERTSPYESRFPINSTITGLVATKGETVNIANTNCDTRFDFHINEQGELRHKSILCMPIHDPEGGIMGVISLINKKTGSFSENDERFVQAFGVFCGMALSNVSNYELAKKAEARSQVALDIMAYHASASEEEAELLAKQSVPAALTMQLQSFSFTEMVLGDDDTLKASVRMFMDLDLVNRFHMDKKTLCRWLLTVKKNYRAEVKYHNWRHAFSVAQVMFSSLLVSGWWSGLGDTACLGLMLACLCHDLDHRGTNNQFQVAVNSPLAKLYTTSTLERHHLHQALLLLNLEGNRILDNLSQAEYADTLAVVEEAILATDLSLHFQHLSRLLSLAELGPLTWQDPAHAVTVKAALMTAADLGAVTRPWPVQRAVVKLVTEEFWEQGDLERQLLAVQPQPLMDRALNHQMPKLQVGFCDGVCIPVYSALTSLCPSLSPLLEGARYNRDRWAELAENNPEEGVAEGDNTVGRKPSVGQGRNI